jgi:hypothetical protein
MAVQKIHENYKNMSHSNATANKNQLIVHNNGQTKPLATHGLDLTTKAATYIFSTSVFTYNFTAQCYSYVLDFLFYSSSEYHHQMR